VKEIPEIAVPKYISLSRKIFWLGWALPFILAAVLAAIILLLESKWIWLTQWEWLLTRAFYLPLLVISYLSLIVSLVTPSLLFLLFRPDLGAAWLRGINPIFYRKPWEELSDSAKFYAFLHAIFFLVMGVLTAYQLIINNWHK
jgi:hypothetical protein